MAESDNFVPVALGMSISTMTYATGSRTTLCDIMCTSNTESEYRLPKKSIDAVTAKLPYEHMSTMNSFVKKKLIGSTIIASYKHATNQEKRNNMLKRERNAFFAKMEKEKYEKESKQNYNVTRIQAIFRGYLIRRPTSYKRKQPKDWNNNAHLMIKEIQHDLCNWAELLDLKPIAGLSLEHRGRKSKRRAKIELAAVINIQAFMRVMIARIKANKMAAVQKQKRSNHAAKVLQKFFKWVMKQRQSGELFCSKRHKSSIKIQTRFRIFIAREKVREMKKIYLQGVRRKEATYKIVCLMRRILLKKRVLKRIRNSQKTES